MTENPAADNTEATVPLKDPALAAFLAWLVPGLGHLYQGRTAKAALFFICIMGTFVFGLYLGSSKTVGWGRVVYVSWRPLDQRLPYLCQVGVGLPAMPALVQAMRVRNGREPFLFNFMAPPAEDAAGGQPTLDMLHRQLARYFELGTVYTMVAGLLNILAIYDAWGGPVAMVSREDDDEEPSDEKKDAQDG